MERYQELQMHQRYVCDILAIYWGLEPNEILDGIIDDNTTLPMFHNLFEEGGRRALMVFYQEGDPPPIGTVFFFNLPFAFYLVSSNVFELFFCNYNYSFLHN